MPVGAFGTIRLHGVQRFHGEMRLQDTSRAFPGYGGKEGGSKLMNEDRKTSKNTMERPYLF